DKVPNLDKRGQRFAPGFDASLDRLRASVSNGSTASSSARAVTARPVGYSRSFPRRTSLPEMKGRNRDAGGVKKNSQPPGSGQTGDGRIAEKQTAEQKRIAAAIGRVRISAAGSVLKTSQQFPTILPQRTSPKPRRPLSRKTVVSSPVRKTSPHAFSSRSRESLQSLGRKTSVADRSLIIDSELVPSRSERMNESSSEFDRPVRRPPARPPAPPAIQIIPRKPHPNVEPATTFRVNSRPFDVARVSAVGNGNLVRQAVASVNSREPLSRANVGMRLAPPSPADTTPSAELSLAAAKVKRMPRTQSHAPVQPAAHVDAPAEVHADTAADSQEPAQANFGPPLLWVLLGGALVVGYVIRRRFSSFS
ncbi:MAG: hypothetical protein IID45_15290, partial [Planctomycetes bacterium]|nr:hypothetical protein [Planctomycetota bacterium]